MKKPITTKLKSTSVNSWMKIFRNRKYEGKRCVNRLKLEETTGVSPWSFISKGLIFVAVFLIPVAFLEGKLSVLPNSYTLKRDCVEENIEKLDLLVLGSSQANYGLNPREFSKTSCNIANSNQDIYYDSKLIEKYLPRAKELKTVIWGISYFSLEFRLRNTEEAWRQYFYYQYLSIPPLGNKMLDPGYFSKILAYKPSVVRGFMEKGFNVNLIDKNTNYGWFMVPPTKEAFNENTGEERARLHTSQMDTGLIQSNLAILKRTTLSLKERNIKTMIVMLPVADTYRKGVNQIKYESTVNLITGLSHEYGIPYYNFFNSSEFKREDFADSSDHLNTQGVQKLAKLLKEKEESLQK